MINRLHDSRISHFAIALAGTSLALMVAVPAQGQQCTTVYTDLNLPLQGVSGFSASVTMSWTGQHTCVSGNPPPTCSDSCHAQVGGLSGTLFMSFCWTWDPETGQWCSPAGATALAWGYSNHSGASVVEFGQWQGMPVTGNATISFSHPVYAYHSTDWVSGGRHLGGLLYAHAGETIALEYNFDGLGPGPEAWFEYRLCPDVDSNGTCDEYDRAARAFGDFDSSGSVNGADLAALLAAWGPCTGPCEADLDADGSVSGSDLGILLSRWGQGAP